MSLDDTIFGLDQAYMALSRGHMWEGVEIIDLNWNTFLTDQEAVEEYEQLVLISQQMKSNLLASNIISK